MKTIAVKNRLFQFSEQTRENIAFAISLMCIFLFALSAYEKLIDQERFAAGLAKVKLIGAYSSFIALAVPIAEIAISLLLIYPVTQRLGLYAFTVLMTVFTLYIASMLFWAEKLPCHCNLIIAKLSFAQHLWFNIGFIVLALLSIYLKKNLNK